jgi:hypothetical protein
MSDPTSDRAAETDVVFIGWQDNPWGEAFPLYDITAPGHPSRGSTVTARELRRLRLQVPTTPRQPHHALVLQRRNGDP